MSRGLMLCRPNLQVTYSYSVCRAILRS